jgi:uncharacterized protein
MMEFDGHFSLPRPITEVVALFADVERVSAFMPGAHVEGRDENGWYLGSMVLSFGPKRITLRGKVNCIIDCEKMVGSIEGRAAADLRAARVSGRLEYTLSEDRSGSRPGTIVHLTVKSDLQGVLAQFAKAGGIPVLNALMKEFARRLAGAEQLADASQTPVSLSAVKFTGSIIREIFRR